MALPWLKDLREWPFESSGWKNCTKGNGAQTKQAAEGRVLSLEEETLAYLQLQRQALQLSITGSATSATMFAERYPDLQAITDHACGYIALLC